MKKVFLIFMSIMLIMCFAGCNENEKVNINFIMDGTSHMVEFNKGCSITDDVIPLSSQERIIEIYYDEEYKNKYDNASINDDITMYVKIIIDDLNKYLEKTEADELIIKQAYCNQVNVFQNISYEPNDFNIKWYFGKLAENKYVVVMENDIRTNIDQYQNIQCNNYTVDLTTFEYLPEIISIIFEGKYYDIKQAFEQNIILRDDVKTIKYIYDYVLNKETKIKMVFLEKYKEDLKDLSINDLALRPVYEDNDICVLFIDGGFYYVECLTYEKIDDLVIGYSNGQHLLVYKSNNLYTLSEAFNEKIISYDVLKEISNIQSQYVIEIENDYKNYE